MKPVLVFHVLLAALMSDAAFAQALPAPSRTVYKCEVAGKTVYSDSPCPGAERLEIQPTRGVSKVSGREQVGADIRREQFRESVAGAVRPLTGMDAKQFEIQGRRMKLSAEAQQECRRLDADILALETDEKSVSGDTLSQIQQLLFSKRSKFRDLRC